MLAVVAGPPRGSPGSALGRAGGAPPKRAHGGLRARAGLHGVGDTPGPASGFPDPLAALLEAVSVAELSTAVEHPHPRN